MSDTLRGFVDALEADDMVQARDVFTSVLGDRLSTALDDKKIEVATTMYGDADEIMGDLDDDDFAIDADEVEIEEVEEEEI